MTNLQTQLRKMPSERRLYVLWSLPGHLAHGGKQGYLRRLLLDFNWMQAKLEATDINALLADFETAGLNRSDLSNVYGALKLSADVLSRDIEQLEPHLWGRLLSFNEPRIKSLLAQIALRKKRLRLRPYIPCMTPPGGALLRTLACNSGPLWALAITPDGRRCVCGGEDGSLKIWDTKTGRCITIPKAHSGSVCSLAITQDGREIISGGRENTIYLWDAKLGERLRVLSGHHGPVRSIAVTQDGSWAISGSHDKRIKVWNLESGVCVHTIKPKLGLIFSVAFSADRYRAICGGFGKEIRVLDLDRGVKILTLRGHSASVSSIAVSADRKLALSGSDDNTVRIWDIQTGTCLHTLNHHSRVTTVAITPDGGRAVSASVDGTLNVWIPISGKHHSTIENIGEVYAIRLTCDGGCAISAGTDSILRFWRLGAACGQEPIAKHSACVKSAAISKQRPVHRKWITRLNCTHMGPYQRSSALLSSWT